MTISELVKEVVGFEGKLVWDCSKPDGMPRKLMDSSKLDSLGWTPKLNEDFQVNGECFMRLLDSIFLYLMSLCIHGFSLYRASLAIVINQCWEISIIQ